MCPALPLEQILHILKVELLFFLYVYTFSVCKASYMLQPYFCTPAKSVTTYPHFVFTLTVRVPDAGIYMLGLPLFPSNTVLRHTPPSSSSFAPETPRNGVEVR